MNDQPKKLVYDESIARIVTAYTRRQNELSAKAGGVTQDDDWEAVVPDVLNEFFKLLRSRGSYREFVRDNLDDVKDIEQWADISCVLIGAYVRAHDVPKAIHGRAIDQCSMVMGALYELIASNPPFRDLIGLEVNGMNRERR